MARCLAMLLLVVMSMGSATNHSLAQQGEAQPRLVILLKVDGLHPDAIERFDLHHIQTLQARGTSAETGVMIFPAHPTVGPYGDWHTTSFPNVSTLAGTLFLTEQPRFLQHVFRSRGKTLHAAGSAAYRSLNRGFDYILAASGASDREVIDFAIRTLEDEDDIAFARIMLQETGAAGRVQSGKNRSDDPWAQNVFYPGSPYERALRQADREIGRLLGFLDRRGKLGDTLFIVMGDGQSRHGWHLTLDEEAALTPIIFAGPGVAAGRTIDYAENIDVAPTVAALAGLEGPNADGGTGRVLTGIFVDGEPLDHPKLLTAINRQIRDYQRLHAEAVLASFDNPTMNLLLMELQHELLSHHQFFTPGRVMEWAEAGDLAAMVAANDWVLETLRLAVRDEVYRLGDF